MNSVQQSQPPQQSPRDSINSAHNSGLSSPTSLLTDQSNGTGGGNKSGKTNGTPSTGRRLLSRLIPFRPRAPPTDFHILPKDPYRIYAPGDTVEGWVVLATEKPVRITHLTVALHGYIRVYKNKPAVPHQVIPPTGPSGTQYHGNGYATLFQDEQVLSGEGKLERGRFRFAFTLLFPSRTLPSNIDFERGTICYDIVATLTRPTAIGPTVQCNRPVSLGEKIDIGMIRPPAPYQILLEPISKSRRNRRRRVPTNLEKTPSIEKTISFERQSSLPETTIGEALADHEDSESIAPSAVSEDPRLLINSEQIDIRSEASTETGTTSTGTGTGTAVSYRIGDISNGSGTGSGTLGQYSQVIAQAANVEKNTIRANMELMRGGFLPGDTITAKVSVQHIRRLKSMHGIIVTLYRQTRIETSPLPGMFDPDISKEDLLKMASDDVLPKSRTGLAGLSLSSTSSVSVFRKDLRQVVLPLLLHPETLDYSVPISIRVPEDAFPTIANVPGQMLSFKYFLEIIVDLGGRLSNQFQSGTSGAALLTIPRNPTNTDVNSQATHGNPMITPIETSQLRREKGVVYHMFPLVVGTLDSSRIAARMAQEAAQAQAQAELELQTQIQAQQPPTQPSVSTVTVRANQSTTLNEWVPDQKRPAQQDYTNVGSSSSQPPPPPHHHSTAAPQYVPTPYIIGLSQLSEKDRIRLQEQALLPSQPIEDGYSDGPSSSMQPFAPLEDVDIYGLESEYVQPSAPPLSHLEPSAPPLEELEATYDVPPADHRDPSGSAPIYQPPQNVAWNFQHPQRPTSGRPPLDHNTLSHTQTPLNPEDEQELEQLRLINQTNRPSAPLEEDLASEGRSSAPVPSAPVLEEPTALVLDVHDDFDFGSAVTNGTHPSGSHDEDDRHDPAHEQLPAYEK